ncbi:hypothetical protein RIF23_09305 [Lipingzhangella sp. LS1_29]|uniref:Uncharacterized protein n=1 Tax=Lipingzhangella rawalii TaxID=2055835 RepID=A0ABU2H5B0_9ACTN|nr:hypothetical protein [Lipingzhangella rawalii]MDS1270491.1 hypothetical protein [Lipingzhangella rawalii]
MPDQAAHAVATVATVDTAVLDRTTGGERETLETLLGLHRAVVSYRAAGLSGRQARHVGQLDILRAQIDGARGGY